MRAPISCGSSSTALRRAVGRLTRWGADHLGGVHPAFEQPPPFFVLHGSRAAGEGAGRANTSVTDLADLGVVAAQPSRLWGGRPLLRVTTRSGFSELFTLNGRGYCRNSSSFRSKPPSVEPKDSSPYQGRTTCFFVVTCKTGHGDHRWSENIGIRSLLPSVHASRAQPGRKTGYFSWNAGAFIHSNAPLLVVAARRRPLGAVSR